MICRIKLNLEIHHTLSKYCEDCSKNTTNCIDNCIIADGNKRSFLSVNRMLPGPAIQVCQNDIVVVDTTNKVPGQDFAIHWRGQHMQATPCMDGVPMVTQCSIPSFTTFQYKFRATVPGTHLWHAHSNSHVADGIFGALIVRQPSLLDAQRRLYDVDNMNYTLLISEWNRKSLFNVKDIKPALLINGRGNVDGYVHEFHVRKGLRYRFRVGHIGGPNSCPIELTIAKHHLKIIALDGHPTVPYEVSVVRLVQGERLDFVLKANQKINSYSLEIISQCDVGAATSVIGSVVYDGSDVIMNDLKDTDIKDNKENSRLFETGVCSPQIERICINDAQSLFVMPSSLRKETVENKLYLTFDHLIIERKDGEESSVRVPRVNNITFTFPTSPLLSQSEDVLPESVCNLQRRPDRCLDKEICECVHVEQLALDSSVEIVLYNADDDDEEHIFHLHGYSFYIVGSRQLPEPISIEEIKKLDENGGLLKRNLKSPVYKDTIRIPKHSVVVIRFVASNPGYWLLRDERASHWSRGMDLILQVGTKRDFQTIPFNFPKCGNWIGPEFFLA